MWAKRAAAGFLAGHLSYDVPEQDLGIDRTRLPALPYSRLIIRNVRAAEDPPVGS